MEEMELGNGEDVVTNHGLTIITAALFILGEMAGSGALKLPSAMIGTGWTGSAIILLCAISLCYSGTRLGMCTIILAERYEDFKKQIRDPYPIMGEKTFGKMGRMVAIVCLIVAHYGGCCVFISLIADMSRSLLQNIDGIHLDYGKCAWMAIITAALIPMTWMGTPKDMLPIAAGALLVTVTSCICVIVQSTIDYNVNITHNDVDDTSNKICQPGNGIGCEVNYPTPTVEGFFTAFSTIVFAFSGASSFPTIQADMEKRSKFPISAMIACGGLFCLYLPLALTGYFFYGDRAKANIIDTISHGGLRVTSEVCYLVQLIAVFPIVLNAPTQYFEQLLKIPTDFNWKRVAFRGAIVLLLLFIVETIPDFGSILDLVGATAITLLTFVLPPLFYMRLCDSRNPTEGWPERKIPIWERIYCWFLILLGTVGGVCATYAAVKNIVSTNFKIPCYFQ